MSEAPERLYILWDDGMVEDWAEVVCEGADHIEYVRADIHEAEIERLGEQIDSQREVICHQSGEKASLRAEVERLREELRENEGVIAVWRRRTAEAESERDLVEAQVESLQNRLANAGGLPEELAGRVRNSHPSDWGILLADILAWHEAQRDPRG